MSSLTVFSLVSSVLTLTLISCDRFFGIVFAMKAHLTERKALPLIAVIWVVSVGLSTPLLFYRHQFSRVWANHVEIWCGDTWPAVRHLDPDRNASIVSHPSRTFYYTFISIVLYFIPIVVMTAAYSLIIWKLWRKRTPGERIDTEVNVQMKMKRRVSVKSTGVGSRAVQASAPFLRVYLSSHPSKILLLFYRETKGLVISFRIYHHLLVVYSY